jgi:hypothetical protein
MRALAEEIYAEALDGLPGEARAQLIATLQHVRANLADQPFETRAVAS